MTTLGILAEMTLLLTLVVNVDVCLDVAAVVVVDVVSAISALNLPVGALLTGLTNPPVGLIVGPDLASLYTFERTAINICNDGI